VFGRRGAVDIESAAGTEDPASNPARYKVFEKVVVYHWPNIYCLHIYLRNKGMGHQKYFLIKNLGVAAPR
jgi:hypothetical protein